MIAPDVNVLLYAFREDSARHADYHAWLENAPNGTESVALFEPVLSAVLRIATHPAVFRPPSPRDAVEAFIDTCLAAPAAMDVRAEATRDFPSSAGGTRSTEHPPPHPQRRDRFDPRCEAALACGYEWARAPLFPAG